MSKRAVRVLGFLTFALILPVMASAFVVSVGPGRNSKPSQQAESDKGQASKGKLKVHVDAKKVVYWPMDLPFWVRLATHPGDGQESYLLQHVAVKDSGETKGMVNEGVRLEIPGSQFIRWMNHVSKSEIQYRFIADGQPPLTQLKFMQAARYESGKALFFGKGLQVELQATDEHSGVAHSYISQDKAAFAEYQGRMNFDTEKAFSLAHYAADNVGYESAVKSTEFSVDLTPPLSKAEPQNNVIGAILSTNSRFILSSEDQLSGVKTTYYKFNNEANFKEYDPARGISVASLADGTQILKFYSEDQVANKEPIKEQQFFLDRSPPSVAYTLSGDSYATGDRRYISSRSRIKFDASDGQVKVKEILYAVNGAEKQVYSTPFTPTGKQGEISLEYQAIDELGNRSELVKSLVVMDDEAPKTKHSIIGRHHLKEAGVVFLGADSKIQLNASDNLSGVKQIEYQLNDAAPAIFSEALSLPGEGRYLFRYWSSDKVNNQETYVPMLFISDRTGPEIVETFSSEPLRRGKADLKHDVYNLNSSLSLSARDNAAGLAKIEFSKQGDKWQSFSSPIALNQKGMWIIKIKAIDHVGNTSEKNLQFEVVDRKWNAQAH
jgi:hypothetical protein